MKKHLNTLFVTTQGTYLSKEGECVQVRVDGVDKAHIPIHTLGGIVCFGNVLCSPFLLGHCAEHGVAVSFLTENGRFLASVRGPVAGNVLQRREQYRWADDPKRSAEMARYVLTGKLANSRSVLLRAARDHGGDGRDERLRAAALRLADCLRRIERSETSLDEVRGMEGEAGATYFAAFDALITADDEAFRFTSRNRRPPLDPKTACSHSYTPCWSTTSGERSSAWASTPRSASCIAIGRAGRGSLWTSWRSSGPWWRIGWPSLSSTSAK